MVFDGFRFRWGPWRFSWGPLGTSQGSLETLLGPLGTSRRSLETLLGTLGDLPGIPGDPHGEPWGPPGDLLEAPSSRPPWEGFLKERPRQCGYLKMEVLYERLLKHTSWPLDP